MTQVFIVCVCSAIKNSQETGWFVYLFAFDLVFSYVLSIFVYGFDGIEPVSA